MAEVMTYMGSGVPGEVAAAEAGIPRSTYYDWMRRGETGEQPYSDFSDGIKRADAKEHRAQVTALQEAFDDGNPHLRLTWVQKRWARHYVEQSRVEVSGPGGGPIALSPVLAQVPKAELDAAIKELEAELGDDNDG